MFSYWATIDIIEEGSISGGDRVHLDLRIGNGYLGVIYGVTFPIIHPGEDFVWPEIAEKKQQMVQSLRFNKINIMWRERLFFEIYFWITNGIHD